MGYWDGAAPADYFNGPKSYGPSADKVQELRRLDSLEPASRIAVLSHEAGGLFEVTPGTKGTLVLKGRNLADAKSNTLLTLTPPDLKVLESQLIHLRTSQDLRSDRMSEILMQQGDMLSFFGAQQKLNLNRLRWTAILLHALYNAIVGQEQRIKHLANVPRPIDLAPQVQPVIQTPGHSSYPSGHATEAFTFAVLISALRRAAAHDPAKPKSVVAEVAALLAKAAKPAVPEQPGPADADTLLLRLATRIADNRTVAGVHFPVDSGHGALLGCAGALAFIAHSEGLGATVPAYAASGMAWNSDCPNGDFTLESWRNAVHATWSKGDASAAKAPEGWHSLPAVWAAAVNEWRFS